MEVGKFGCFSKPKKNDGMNAVFFHFAKYLYQQLFYFLIKINGDKCSMFERFCQG